MSNCRRGIALLLTVFHHDRLHNRSGDFARLHRRSEVSRAGELSDSGRGWEEYLVKRFSVTDSTVVIEELSPGDERFRMGRGQLPYVISWDRVESIARVKINPMGTAAIVLTVGLLVSFIVWLSTADLDIGE